MRIRWHELLAAIARLSTILCISGSIPHPVSQPSYLAALEGDNLICLPFSLVCPVTLLRLSACNMSVQPNENYLIYYLFSFNGHTLKALNFTGFLKNFSTKKVLNLLCCLRIHYTVISSDCISRHTCCFC